MLMMKMMPALCRTVQSSQESCRRHERRPFRQFAHRRRLAGSWVRRRRRRPSFTLLPQRRSFVDMQGLGWLEGRGFKGFLGLSGLWELESTASFGDVRVLVPSRGFGDDSSSWNAQNPANPRILEQRMRAPASKLHGSRRRTMPSCTSRARLGSCLRRGSGESRTLNYSQPTSLNLCPAYTPGLDATN